MASSRHRRAWMSGGRARCRESQRQVRLRRRREPTPRQVFVLQEGADRVLVFDERLTAVNREITLSVPRDQPDLGPEWYGDDNARGEGLLLLRNGHILVGKQRKEPRLIEFGPPDDAPKASPLVMGCDPTRRFRSPMQIESPLACSRPGFIDPDSGIESVNDLALDAGGALHLGELQVAQPCPPRR